MSGRLFESLERRSHPQRSTLTAEMHLRKPPRFDAPAQMLELVMLAGEAEFEANADMLRPHVRDFDPAQRFWIGEIEGFAFACERHSEFITYSFVASGATDALFDIAVFRALEDWVADAPGQPIRANHVQFLDIAGGHPEPERLSEHFSPDDLVICDVFDRKARIWSDFRIHADGFGRLLIADRGLSGSDASLILQRVQELGNYRKMALLGLPVAQELMPRISLLERRLSDLTQRVADEDSDDETTMAELSRLSAELAQLGADTRYRMSATQAYADICLDRLHRLDVGHVPGHPSLADFTERRLLPAMRTCDASTRRLNDLSERVSWTSALLRTRIDTRLAKQNRDLLASMNKRTRMQLRLQQTVEGLSAVAISYYLVGLLSYVAKMIPPLGVHVPVELVVGLMVPVVFCSVAFALRNLRRLHAPDPI